jgi:hypothetical protein
LKVVISHFHLFPGSGADHGQDLDELRDLLGQNRGRSEGIYLLRRRVSALRKHSVQFYMASPKYVLPGQPKPDQLYLASPTHFHLASLKPDRSGQSKISSTWPAQNQFYLASPK